MAANIGSKLEMKDIFTSEQNLTGSVERVLFYSSDTGYCVLRVKCRKNQNSVIVTANIPHVTVGENIECYGEWVVHPKFGEQFKASRVVTQKPTDKDAIEKYLCSGVIGGIGEVYAQKLVAVFGDITLEVLEKAATSTESAIPEKLVQEALDVTGKTWHNIKEGIVEYLEKYKKHEQERLWLTRLGVGPMSAEKIIKEFGERTISIITKNPYVLIELVKGFGFVKSDNIALRLGIPADSPFRIKAGIKHVIQESIDSGNCYVEIGKLLKDTAKLLGVEKKFCLDQLKVLVTDDTLRQLDIEGANVVGFRHFDEYEQAIAENIRHLNASESALLDITGIQDVITRFEEKTQWALNAEQKEAIHTALTKHLLVVTGGPGTGKTTITRCISMAIANIAGYKLVGCSPTGRAAKRLSEALNRDGAKIECSSIHRLLEARISKHGKHYFNKHADNKLELDAVIVDEISMVDTSLFYHLLAALPKHARLVIIGDVDQLPSIGAGKILRDLVESNTIPVVRLMEVQRQAANSKIIVNAHRINQGLMPLQREEGDKTDFHFFEVEKPAQIKEVMMQIVCKELPTITNIKTGLPYNPMQDVQVLSPMKKSITGTIALNAALQATLNPDGFKSDNKIRSGDYWFCESDKVIQLQNNYDKGVYNGDIGYILNINKQERILEVMFSNFTNPEADTILPISYKFHELDQLTLAYATTIHKSQGSEYPVVVMPISTQHYIMLQRNLLYTGVTRGKELVILVGQRQALEIAIKNNKTNERVTDLRQRLLCAP